MPKSNSKRKKGKRKGTKVVKKPVAKSGLSSKSALALGIAHILNS